MYVLLLLPIVLAEGYAIRRFLYRREIDGRPGLIGLGLVALGAMVGEIGLPGGWRWFGFAGASGAQLGGVWIWLCLLGAALAAAYLFLDRPFAPRKLILALALGCAAACALQTVAVVGARIDYPFDLEWVEGGLLDHVVRIQGGEPLYRPPDVDFVPSLYAPLYMRVAALFPYLPESPYWIGRELSLFCILSSGALLYAATAAAARCAWTGLLLSLCLLGGALFAGDWFDLFRVDCLFVVLALGAFALLDRARERAAGLAAAGALLAAAVFAKQAGAFVVMAALAWLFASSGPGLAARARRCAWLAAGGLAATAALCAVEIADSGGEWVHYWVEQLDNYPVTWAMFVKTVGIDLFGTPGAVLLWGAVIGAAALVARDPRLLGRDPMVTGGAVLTVVAVLQRSKWGGAENCLLPMLIGCLLLAAHGLRTDGDERGARAMAGVYLLMLVGFLWQMDLAGNKLAARIPSQADLRATRQLVEWVRTRPGPVVAPERSHIVYQARGETSFHEIFAHDWAVQHPYPERIREALEARRPAALLLRSDRLLDAPPAVVAAIKRGYSCAANIFHWPRGTADAITGWRIPPPTFCERNRP